VSRCQKGKTDLDFTEARDSEWQWHQLGHMQVCPSLQTDNHASSPPLCFLQAGCPSCRPTNSVKALKEPWCKEDQCCQNPAGRPEVVSRRGRDHTKTRRRQDCCCCRPVATTGRRHELAGARVAAHGPTTHRRISDSAPARRTRRVAAAPAVVQDTTQPVRRSRGVSQRTTTQSGTKVCRYSWHGARSPGWPFPMLKYKYIFQIEYTAAILSNSTQKLSRFEISKMLTAV